MTTCREFFTFSWPLRGRGRGGGRGRPKRLAWPLLSRFFFYAFPNMNNNIYMIWEKHHFWSARKKLKVSSDHPALLLAQVYKRKEKFYCPFFIFGWAVKRTKSTLDWVVVTYSDHWGPSGAHLEHPKQWFLGFCSSPLLDLIFKGLNSSACSIG